MSYDLGGRADKLGNRYEGRWVALQLLHMLNEEVVSVTVESIGDDERGVDLWISKKNGKKLAQQCKGRNGNKDTWNSIRSNDGSVQHLDFLTQHEKDVFKTFAEIDQYVVLEQASMCQKFIDQGQSLNIMVNPQMSVKEINELHIFAWENEIKTLYYQHSTNASQQFSKNKLCASCEA